MAAYEARTKLDMLATVARAREFFEMAQGLTVQERLGALYRWRAPDGDVIELRCFPVRGGGTRLELDTRHNDALALAFIKALPQPGLLDDLRGRLSKPRP